MILSHCIWWLTAWLLAVCSPGQHSTVTATATAAAAPTPALARLPELPTNAKYRQQLLHQSHQMFTHAYNNYLQHAFPRDELRSLSGSGANTLVELGSNGCYSHSQYNGVALTLVDSLSTLAVLKDATAFTTAVEWLLHNAAVLFDVDARVSVFETNIRMLGGLLSAHLLANATQPQLMPSYNGQLLSLADDLGQRLLRAFTNSSIFPYSFVHLRHGVAANETYDQCVAGVGTLLMEFGTLGYLTNNTAYLIQPYRALRTMYDMRSAVDLLGNSFDIITGQYKDTLSSTGAGVDSFYEYLLKGSIMLDDPQLMQMFNTQYTAINRHMGYTANDGRLYHISVHSNSGQPAHVQFNSLQAFYPALLTLHGDLQTAQTLVASYFHLWSLYSSMPERVYVQSVPPQLHNSEYMYPLRPELVESIYYVYRATRDEQYLRMGERIMHDLEQSMKTDYGYASMRNVQSRELEDHMPSYFLSETCKYLYLLFSNDSHWLHQHESKYLFTTEGHVLPVLPGMQRWRQQFAFGDFDRTAAQGGEISLPACNVPFSDTRSPFDSEWLQAVDPSVHHHTSSAVVPTVQSSTQTLQTVDPALLDSVAAFQKLLTELKVDIATTTNSRGELVPVFAPELFRIEYFAGKVVVRYGDHTTTIYDLMDTTYSIVHQTAQTFTPFIVEPQSTLQHAVQIHVSNYNYTLHRNASLRSDWSSPKLYADLPALSGHHAHLYTPLPDELLDEQLQCAEDASIALNSAVTSELAQSMPSAALESAGGSIESAYIDIDDNEPELIYFDDLMGDNSTLIGELMLYHPPMACTPVHDVVAERERLRGKIVVVERGQCMFSQKVLNAQSAGAKAVIIANTDAQEPLAVFPARLDRPMQQAPSAEPSSAIHLQDGDITVPVFMLSYGQSAHVVSTLRQKATQHLVALAARRKQSPRRTKPSAEEIVRTSLLVRIQRQIQPLHEPVSLLPVSSAFKAQGQSLRVLYHSATTLIVKSSVGYHISIERITLPMSVLGEQQPSELQQVVLVARVF